LGKVFRAGEYVPNAEKDADGDIHLKDGMEVIKIDLPLPRKARVVQKKSDDEIMKELLDKHEAGQLTEVQYEKLAAQGMTKQVLDIIAKNRQ
jgi:uncharacterized protein YbcV (DUF1398 family)